MSKGDSHRTLHRLACKCSRSVLPWPKPNGYLLATAFNFRHQWFLMYSNLSAGACIAVYVHQSFSKLGGNETHSSELDPAAALFEFIVCTTEYFLHLCFQRHQLLDVPFHALQLLFRADELSTRFLRSAFHVLYPRFHFSNGNLLPLRSDRCFMFRIPSSDLCRWLAPATPAYVELNLDASLVSHPDLFSLVSVGDHAGLPK